MRAGDIVSIEVLTYAARSIVWFIGNPFPWELVIRPAVLRLFIESIWFVRKLPCDFNVEIVLSSARIAARRVVSYAVTWSSIDATWSLTNLIRALKSFSDDVMYPEIRSVAFEIAVWTRWARPRRVGEVAEVAGPRCR